MTRAGTDTAAAVSSSQQVITSEQEEEPEVFHDSFTSLPGLEEPPASTAVPVSSAELSQTVVRPRSTPVTSSFEPETTSTPVRTQVKVENTNPEARTAPTYTTATATSIASNIPSIANDIPRLAGNIPFPTSIPLSYYNPLNNVRTNLFNHFPSQPTIVPSDAWREQGYRSERGIKPVIPTYKRGDDLQVFLKRFERHLGRQDIPKIPNFGEHLLENVNCDELYPRIEQIEFLTSCTSAAELVKMVRDHLFTPEDRLLARRELMNLKQWANEPISEFDIRIRQKSNIVFSGDLSSPEAESLMTEAFSQGLRDYETARTVLMNGITGYQAVVRLAGKSERVAKLANRDMTTGSHSPQPIFQISSSRANHAGLGETVCQICRGEHSAIQCPLRQNSRVGTHERQEQSVPRRPNQGRTQDSSTVQCWVCNQFGHVRRHCPNRRQASLNSRVAQAAASQGHNTRS